MKEVTYKELRESEEIKAYIEQGNAVLGALGFTEHSEKHAVKTAETAGKILKELGYPKRTRSWPGSRDISMIWGTV